MRRGLTPTPFHRHSSLYRLEDIELCIVASESQTVASHRCFCPSISTCDNDKSPDDTTTPRRTVRLRQQPPFRKHILREASDKPLGSSSFPPFSARGDSFKRFCGSVENKGSFIISFELLLASSLSKRTSSVQDFAAPPSLPSPAIQLFHIASSFFLSSSYQSNILEPTEHESAHFSFLSFWKLSSPARSTQRPLDATSQRLHTNRAPRPRHCTSTFSS